MIRRDAGEVVRGERGKVGAKPLSVGVAEAEGHEGADVADDGLLDVFRELIDVLVSQVETDTVFADFGEHAGKGIGDDVLEFVDVDVEWRPLLGRDIGAGHGGHLDFGHDKRTKELGIEAAEFAFAQVNE